MHLPVLSCHSSVHMAHWKSSNNFPSSLFFHSLCIRSSLHSTRPHRPFVGPGPSLSAASTVAPAARSCSRMAVWPATAAWCSGVAPQAPKGSETSTAGGLHPVALHRQTPAAVGETAICRVNSVSFIFSKIVRRAGSMAATIVSGVCEDHEDYELMEPSTTEFPKKGKTFSYD